MTDVVAGPPLVRPTAIRRALMERLSAHPRPRVVSVAAPAGSGKTTLLRQWRDVEPTVARWLPVQTAHHDPVSFVVDLARALASGHRGTAVARVVPELRATDPMRGVARLIRSLDRARSPLVLMLDDAHLLTGHRSLDVLTMFVDRMPGGFQVALAARSEVALPFARWRASGWLEEIGVAELALDAVEVETVLRAHKVAPSVQIVDQVLAATEGWAVGVYLTALAISRGEGVPDASLVRGDHRFISAFLESQVLADRDPVSRDLLSRTSILATVNGSLADAVTQGTDSALRLEDIARRNLLVMPVDDERRSYRYHSLLRDVLTRQLVDAVPDVGQLHARASAWYEAAGQLDHAVAHAFQSGDIDLAARLVVQSVQAEYRQGRVATVRTWLSGFDDEALIAHPGLACLATMVAALEGEPKDAARGADLAFRSPLRDVSATVIEPAPDRWLVRALLCPDGPEAMLQDAERSLGAHGPSWAWWPTALLVAGAAEKMLGYDAAALARFEDVDRSTEAEDAVSRWPARAELALAAMGRRDWTRASDILAPDRATMLTDPEGGRLAGMLWLIADARLQLHRGMRLAALERLTLAQLGRTRLSWAVPWYAVRALTELARTQLRIDDGAGARASLAQAREIMEVRPELGALSAMVEEVGRMAAKVPDGRPNRTALSPAELRLLPLLQTYLSFKEIGVRLGITINTVKTEAWSIYAKLGATSRSEAVEHAEESGLLERTFDR